MPEEKRFKVISIRQNQGTGAYREGGPEDGRFEGKKITIDTCARSLCLLQDTSYVYGKKVSEEWGIVAEFYDIVFADKACDILNKNWNDSGSSI